MKNKVDIKWWDFDVPALENWHEPHFSNLDAKDQSYLKSLEKEDTFYSELAGQTSVSDALMINAIAQQTHRRILQKYRIKDTVYWPWVVTTLSVIAVIIFLSMFNMSSQKKERHYSLRTFNQNIPPVLAMNTKTTAITPDEKVHSEPPGHTNETTNNMILKEKSVDETRVDRYDHASIKQNPEHNVVSVGQQIAAAGLDEAEKITESQKTETKESGTEKPETVTKKKNYGERFTSQAGTGKKTTRDANVPLVVSTVRVEQAANYAVYLNSVTKHSDTKNGQISGGEGVDQTRVKFAPEDMPQYPGNNDRLEADLEYLIAKHALKKNYDEVVSVMVSFIIDSKGNMKDIKIHGYKTQEIKSSIQKALAGLDPWKKGKKSGKKGSVRYEILISYK